MPLNNSANTPSRTGKKWPFSNSRGVMTLVAVASRQDKGKRGHGGHPSKYALPDELGRFDRPSLVKQSGLNRKQDAEQRRRTYSVTRGGSPQGSRWALAVPAPHWLGDYETNNRDRCRNHGTGTSCRGRGCDLVGSHPVHAATRRCCSQSILYRHTHQQLCTNAHSCRTADALSMLDGGDHRKTK